MFQIEMSDTEDISHLVVKEEDTFVQENVEDVEGRITDFFLGLFVRNSNEEPVDEEDDFTASGSDESNPFIQDSKLYGQDYDELKVTPFHSLISNPFSTPRLSTSRLASFLQTAGSPQPRHQSCQTVQQSRLNG